MHNRVVRVNEPVRIGIEQRAKQGVLVKYSGPDLLLKCFIPWDNVTWRVWLKQQQCSGIVSECVGSHVSHFDRFV